MERGADGRVAGSWAGCWQQWVTVGVGERGDDRRSPGSVVETSVLSLASPETAQGAVEGQLERQKNEKAVDNSESRKST
jgi:hypothetical protein